MDELFDMMAVTDIGGASDELLIINPDTRQIEIPGNELVFGVEGDVNGERKYFACPRIVGNNIDLATCFVRANYRNANGEMDFDLIDDLTVSGDNVLFSWEVSGKAVAYKGQVKFNISFDRPGKDSVDWHTTMATGISLEGLMPDTEAAVAASQDGIAQLLAKVDEQIGWVEAAGEDQIIAVEQAASDAEAASVAEIEAKGVNTLNSIPNDYTALSEVVDRLERSCAGAIVCEAEGSAITLDDASNMAMQGMRIFGRSTQDGVPTPDAPVEIVSIVNPTVSVDEQTLRINRTLPGIPVTSGGNYTDSDGQQWICDEVDFERGVYVQRVGTATFDGSSDEGIYDNTTKDQTIVFELHLDSGVKQQYADDYVCNRFLTNNNAGDVEKIKIVGIGVYVAINKSRLSELSTVGFRKWLESNHVDIRYVLNSPIETSLSETELAAYRSQHTNKPNTTILNDAGAHMAVEYVADTKLYIHKLLT